MSWNSDTSGGACTLRGGVAAARGGLHNLAGGFPGALPGALWSKGLRGERKADAGWGRCDVLAAAPSPSGRPGQASERRTVKGIWGRPVLMLYGSNRLSLFRWATPINWEEAARNWVGMK